MKSKEIAVTVAIVICGIFLLSAVIYGQYQDGMKRNAELRAGIRTEFEREAIAHGAGEYVIVDETTGATEFRWKDSPDAR